MTDETQTAVRAAWLYYIEGLTQAEVATRLDLTRLRVNRLLAEARQSGLVSIAINSRLDSCVRLERQLVARFALKDALVVPTARDPGEIAGHLGRAAGDYVSRLVEADPSGVFGVGWGSTLRETARHLRPGQHAGLTVTSMMGGLTYGIEINTFEIATRFASAWNADCRYLAAPIYAGTPQSRDTIVGLEVFEEAFARIASTRTAILSVGDLSDRSLLIRYGLPRDVTTSELARAGAVGDLLGQFIDTAGRPVDHPVNRRAVALPLTALRDIPNVVLASGGVNKAQVISAALQGRLATVVITDEQTALQVLAPRQERP